MKKTTKLNYFEYLIIRDKITGGHYISDKELKLYTEYRLEMKLNIIEESINRKTIKEIKKELGI